MDLAKPAVYHSIGKWILLCSSASSKMDPVSAAVRPKKSAPKTAAWPFSLLILYYTNNNNMFVKIIKKKLTNPIINKSNISLLKFIQKVKKIIKQI